MVNIGFSQWNWRFWQEVPLVIQHSYWKISIFNVSIIELNGPFSMDMLKFEYFNVEMMVNIKHWSNLSTLKQNGWLKSAKTWARLPNLLWQSLYVLKFITAGSSSSRKEVWSSKLLVLDISEMHDKSVHQLDMLSMKKWIKLVVSRWCQRPPSSKLYYTS